MQRIFCSLLLLLPFVLGAPRPYTAGNGIGFAISGAASRIAQQTALMEALVRGLTPSGEKIRPDFIAGVSSGAINAVALNAVLETEDKNIPNGYTWEDYVTLIENFTASDVYDNSYLGLIEIMTYNIFEGYFLDNTNLRNFLIPLLARMNYNHFGDLYLPTCITLVNQSSGDDFRMWSTDPQFASLPLVDVIMATTSLPMAFPPRTVTGLGDTLWIDGGTGIDMLPAYPLLIAPDVTTLYLISFNHANRTGGNTLPSYLADIKLLRNGIDVINDMRNDLVVGALEMASKATIPVFSFIPILNQTFSSLDFDHEQLQYNLAMSWAVKNDPYKLNL